MSGPAGQPIALRAAIATVHRDPRWWQKVLLHGALALSGVGLPIAAGFVVESYDNSRKGFPTPLPPWSDWTLRALAGLFALLIDFAFFVLPVLLGGLLTLCAGVALLAAGGAATSAAIAVIGALTGLLLLAMFLLGAAPAARLRFADEGRVDQAITLATLRWALAPPARPAFLRARLASLPAYLPAALLAALLAWLAPQSLPAQGLIVALLLWLLLSAIVYAHLVVAQLYVAAERLAGPPPAWPTSRPRSV